MAELSPNWAYDASYESMTLYNDTVMRTSALSSILAILPKVLEHPTDPKSSTDLY